jgi:hypothetical protein
VKTVGIAHPKTIKKKSKFHQDFFPALNLCWPSPAEMSPQGARQKNQNRKSSTYKRRVSEVGDGGILTPRRSRGN